MLEKIATLFKNKKFLYVIQADKVYYYTNSDKDSIINGTLFKAEYISHSTIKSTTNEPRSKVDITFAINNSFIDNLLDGNITKKISVRILEYYNGIQVPVFFGEVEDKTVNPNEVIVSVAPISANIIAVANKYTYGSFCNHRFTSVPCGVDASANTVVTKVLGHEKNKTVINVNDIDPLFKNGRAVTANGERRMILSVDVANKKITLIGTLNVSVDENISIVKGCDKTPATCTTYGGNFLGEQYVPIRNVFTQGIT